MAFGDRVSTQDYNTVSSGLYYPRKIAGNSTHIYVQGVILISGTWTYNKLIAFNKSTKARDSSKDITYNPTNNTNSLLDVDDIYCDDTYMWVLKETGSTHVCHAYKISDGTRDSSKDINLDLITDEAVHGNFYAHTFKGIGGDANTIWIAGIREVSGGGVHNDDNYAWAFVKSTRARDTSKDFVTGLGEASSIGDEEITVNATHIFILHAQDRPGAVGVQFDVEVFLKSNQVQDTAKLIQTTINAPSGSPTNYNQEGGFHCDDDYLWICDATANRLVAYDIAQSPTIVSVSADAGDTQVELSWVAINATSFKIQYRIKDAVDWTEITGVTGTNRTLTGLTNDKTYEFRVFPIKGNVTGTVSDIVTAIPFSDTVVVSPGIPRNLTATPGNRQVTLVWDSDPLSTRYTVEYRVKDSNTIIPVSDILLTDHTVLGLINGTAYEFRVKGVNNYTSSDPTAWVEATPSPPVITAPAVPTGLTATAGDGEVDIDVTKVSGVSYEIQYKKTSDSNYGDVEEVTRPTTVVGLENGTSYDFQIRGKNSGGTSNWSTKVSATPVDAGSGPPEPITNPNVATVASGQLLLYWTNPNTGGQIEIEYKLKTAITWTKTSKLKGQFPPYTVSGLTNGEVYQFRMRAWRNTLYSTYSAIAEGIPRDLNIPFVIPPITGSIERAVIIKFEHDTFGFVNGDTNLVLGNFEKYHKFKNLTYKPYVALTDQLGVESSATIGGEPFLQLRLPPSEVNAWIQSRVTGEEVRANIIRRVNNGDWELADYGYIGLLDVFTNQSGRVRVSLLPLIERVTKQDPNIWSDQSQQGRHEGDLIFSMLEKLSVKGRYIRIA